MKRIKEYIAKKVWKARMKVAGWVILWGKYRARCAYCGWWLHPQMHFKNTNQPSPMSYCKTKSGNFVCSNCAHNPNSDY